MAIMWPREIPSEIKSNILRSSECRVYQKLQDSLDDSFVVFYSRPWLGLTPYGEEKDGECDFLIAHPDRGILAIEVKGGAVAYDPEMEKWTSRDRWGYVHKIKNPVQQAVSSKHQILTKLNNSSAWRQRFIRARHGVIFPDSEKPKEDLGADIPLHICCFLDEFENDIWEWVMSRLGEVDEHSFRERSLGKDGLNALEEILAHPFQLHAPIGNILAQDDTSINMLTEQQFHILETIQDIHRAVVSGGAGTGKTVLAIEEAIRCANSGMNVLLTCYNRPLAEEINNRLKSLNNITVANFHELCFKFANDAGIEIPNVQNKDQLFSETYPEVFSYALESIPDRRFDVIIVDEGQDFLPGWISVLDMALKSEGNGKLRIFIDNNQSVYGNINIIPDDVQLVPIRLTQNMRNTKRIHSVVQDYYTGYHINSAGPEGVPVEWILANSVIEIHKKINEKINQLITKERLEPSDIAVLCTNEKNIKECAPSGLLGKYKCSPTTKREENSIILDTIRRFKGLESRVVILVATADIINNQEIVYVALSRARTHLIVIGDIHGLKQSTVKK